MNNRLVDLRKALSLTQEQFGEKINLKRTAITAYEKGYNSINDRTIANICNTFNVNEDWLRYGTQPMFRPQQSADNELAAEVASLIKSKDDFTKNLILEILKLPEEQKIAMRDFWVNVINKMPKE